MSEITPEERAEMQASFDRLLADHASPDQMRSAMATAPGFDRTLWKQMADLGILGLIVDAEYGGIGGGPEEVEALMETAGAHLLCGPYLVSSILAASLISATGDKTLKADLLSGLCSGDRIYSVALASEQGSWALADTGVDAKKSGDTWTLSGLSSYVIHGQNADHLLVLAKTGKTLGVFLVEPDATGVILEGLPTNDPTLRLARLQIDKAEGTHLEGISEENIQAAIDLAQVALAGEQAGAAKRIFEITVDYLKTRHQFGRPIGGFQAVKHMAADMLIDVESAISAARHAASVLAKGGADADQYVALASFACADAFRDVSAEAIQLHGGIAYTQEHPAHLYWRRARTGLFLFGDSDLHRETYLTHLEASN